ncbi:MAG: MOFRL family protein, partial [Nitrososphaerota archaeon]
DGVDGPTDAAGAVASSEQAQIARDLSLNPQDYLERNDSYTFFKKVGGHIFTGPTGTNVGDIVLVLSPRAG